MKTNLQTSKKSYRARRLKMNELQQTFIIRVGLLTQEFDDQLDKYIQVAVSDLATGNNELLDFYYNNVVEMVQEHRCLCRSIAVHFKDGEWMCWDCYHLITELELMIGE